MILAVIATQKAWRMVLPDVKKQVLPLPVGTDLAEHLNIEPIYFDFDQWYIRADAQESLSKVITYMKENPTVKVMVRSHTDSRQTAAYNQILSLNRAKATVAYMVAEGIAENRLGYEGLGELELTNPCGDGQPCSKPQHQANRRSEFIVME